MLQSISVDGVKNYEEYKKLNTTDQIWRRLQFDYELEVETKFKKEPPMKPCQVRFILRLINVDLKQRIVGRQFLFIIISKNIAYLIKKTYKN